MTLRRFGFCVIFTGVVVASTAPAQPAAEPARALAATTVTAPDYPLTALIAAEQGTTSLNLTIGPDGRVADAQVTRSSGSRNLDEAAVRIAKGRWRYQPSMRNGQAVTSMVTTDVVWTLPLRPAAQAYFAGAGMQARGPQPPPALADAYPSLSMARGEQGVVGVRYTVGPGGVIQNAELAAPSGYSGLDNAALRIVRAGGGQAEQPGARDRLVAFALVPAHAYGIQARCYAAPMLAHESMLFGGELEFSHFSGLAGQKVWRWRERPIHNWTAIWVQVSPTGTVSDMLLETKGGWMQVPDDLRGPLLQDRKYRAVAAGNCWYYDPVALLN